MKIIVNWMLVRLFQAYLAVCIVLILLYFVLDHNHESMIPYWVAFFSPTLAFIVALPINYFGYKKANK